MTSENIKEQIQQTVINFNKGNLSENALNFFEVLGYNTERRAPLSENTFEEFKESFIDTQKFDENKAKVSDWKYVDLLFQLTKEEVLKQTSLFDTKQVDNTIIETYLFFAIELQNENYTRTELSQISREVNRLFPMPVMLLFKYGTVLTLSVINRRLHKRDADKDVLEKVTLIKDIIIENPHRAHIEILFDLSFEELNAQHSITNFVELHNAWQKTLDTKELNKRFYNELFGWYLWAVGMVRFPNRIDDKKDDTVYNAESMIRLLTRLIFVWFIKEKNLVSEKLFNEKVLSDYLKDFLPKDQKSSSYYKAILQNLFFATLNSEMPKDGGSRRFINTEKKYDNDDYLLHLVYRYEELFKDSKKALELFKDVPFLNGGLFECLDYRDEDTKTEYRFDGFSTYPEKQPHVPNILFFSTGETVDLSKDFENASKYRSVKVRGLIHILKDYKFTIEENTPLDQEIALDPELLGRMFENLLASYNPETKTTARKQTGSFYTPREIVNYMVDESLIEYLKNALHQSGSKDAPSTSSGCSDNIPVVGIATTSSGSSETSSGCSDNIPVVGKVNQNNLHPDFVKYAYFDPENEIQIHNGNLPHWQQEEVIYFITFRLADSIPAEKAEALRIERELWLKEHKKHEGKKYAIEEIKEYNRLFSEKVENWLSAGHGSCVLKNENAAKIVADALLFYNNQKYILDEWVIMPNHVHVLVKPFKGFMLPEILHSWKSFTANEINKLYGWEGQLWMHESYDHIVRNDKVLDVLRDYIRNNPVKANIMLVSCAQSWSYVGGGSKDAPETSWKTSSNNTPFKDAPEPSLKGSSNNTPFKDAPEASLKGSSDNIPSEDAPETSLKGSSDNIPVVGNATTTTFSGSSDNIPVVGKATTTTFSGSSDNIPVVGKATTETKLRSLFSHDTDVPTFSEQEKIVLINAINNVKILDPACGSGAFPMGVLHRMVDLLKKLDPDNSRWKEVQREKTKEKSKKLWDIDDTAVRQEQLDKINRAFDESINHPDYARKLFLIENCIFGIDIQTVAVQISKLRFFISLIVEQIVDDSKPNRNILSMPNLEAKFVAANTLIGLNCTEQLKIETNELYSLKEELKEVRHLYFSAASRPEKLRHQAKEKELRKKIGGLIKAEAISQQQALRSQLEKVKAETTLYQKQNRSSLREEQLKRLEKSIAENLKKMYAIEKLLTGEDTISTDADKIASFDPYNQINSNTWFEPDWMFGINTGFDIVIGNPPYVDSESMVKHFPNLRENISKNYKCAKGNWDLYIVFLEKAFNLQKLKGYSTYIIPNKWLSAPYGKEIRRFLKDYFIKLVNCSDIKVFEAGNTPVIFSFGNSSNDACISEFNSEWKIDFVSYISNNQLSQDNWGSFLSKNYRFLDFLSKKNQKLKDYYIVENPFSTSEAYLLCSIVEDNSNFSNSFKLITTGSIDPYSNYWGINITSYLKGKYKHPIINKIKFQKILPKRYEQQNCPKIALSGMRYFEAFFDTTGEYLSSKSTIIIKNLKSNQSGYSLLCLLNSKLISFYLKESFSSLGIDGGINFSKEMVEDLPYNHKLNSEKFYKLGEAISKIKQKNHFTDTTSLENQIDELVFKLYGLTYEEVLVVCPDFWLSEGEYEGVVV